MIYIASDHAGLRLKSAVRDYLASMGMDVTDAGPYAMDPQDDYPDYIIPAAEEVAKDPSNRGIIFGGSGQGEAIAANKVAGIRAVVWYGGPMDIVRLSRLHNDSNVLSIGARFVADEEVIEAVELWLSAPFEGERHERRIRKISAYEKA